MQYWININKQEEFGIQKLQQGYAIQLDSSENGNLQVQLLPRRNGKSVTFDSSRTNLRFSDHRRRSQATLSYVDSRHSRSLRRIFLEFMASLSYHQRPYRGGRDRST